jgi:hypothetical protein
VTLSLGFSKANPKTSKPDPILALVAGAFTMISLSGIISSQPGSLFLKKRSYALVDLPPD